MMQCSKYSMWGKGLTGEMQKMTIIHQEAMLLLLYRLPAYERLNSHITWERPTTTGNWHPKTIVR